MPGANGIAADLGGGSLELVEIGGGHILPGGITLPFGALRLTDMREAGPQAFAAAVLDGLDGFFIGHFHRDETLRVPGHDATLRIVPDWFSRKQVLRLHPDGRQELLTFPTP